MSILLSCILSLLAFSPIALGEDSQKKYNITMGCECIVYNEDGIVVNSQINIKGNNNFPQLDVFGYAFGEKLNVFSAEAELCEKDLLNDITQSCAGAYARVIGSCMDEAKLYNPDMDGFLNYSIDNSTCFSQVKEAN